LEVSVLTEWQTLFSRVQASCPRLGRTVSLNGVQWAIAIRVGWELGRTGKQRPRVAIEGCLTSY
ncbi:MAG: hypothetical protein AAGJ55_02310, partial [Cyanobacteria bacterium J06555_12]